MQRVKLLIDMDDCILDFESTWKRLFIEMIGNYDFPERKSFYIYHDLPIEFHEKAREIANHPELFLMFNMYDGAYEALNELHEEFDVELVTAPHTTNINCYTHKAQWIHEHLGSEWLNCLTITKDKKQIIGDYLIDDHPNVVGRNIIPMWKQIVFDQAYNQNIDCCYRLKSWEKEEVEKLKKFIKSQKT